MTDIPTEAALLARIKAFLARHDMAPSRFGRDATGEPQIISSIEGGRSPSLKVVHRIIAFMAEQDARAGFSVVAPTTPTEGDRAVHSASDALNPNLTEAAPPFAPAPEGQRSSGASAPICSPTSGRSSSSADSLTSSGSEAEAA